MTIHMLKEEQVLFPCLKLVEESAQAGVAPPPAFFGRLINPIRHMMSVHDDTGELLKSIRALTNDYNLPEGACMSYQAFVSRFGGAGERPAPAHSFRKQHSVSTRPGIRKDPIG
jgi:regulator of cell morphogenesis and NO signaling